MSKPPLVALAVLVACGGVGGGPGQGGAPRLTLAVVGDGTVVSSPAGIACPPQCEEQVAAGGAITLSAQPGPGARFTGWSGGCSGAVPTCALTLGADAHVDAQFTAAPGTHTLSVSVDGAGAVTSSPAGIDCPGTCAATFAQGTAVTLTATAAPAATFANWSGSCAGTGSCAVQMGADASVQARFTPRAVVAIAPADVTVVLPQDCQASFVIANTGPQGSTLAYAVADDGVLGGFLDVTNAAGSIPSGQSATVSVSVKPAFVSSVPSLVGDDLVLDVYTPGASNFTKIAVAVHVRDAQSEAQKLVGTWAGTWSGVSTGYPAPGGPTPTAAVSGRWSLTLDAVDVGAGTASGSLTWTGTDAYWTYDSGVATAHAFVPDRTIALQSSTATTTLTAGGCPLRFGLDVEGYANAPNPSDAFYGPRFTGDLHSDGTYAGMGAAWSAHPYDASTWNTAMSSGSTAGAKLP